MNNFVFVPDFSCAKHTTPRSRYVLLIRVCSASPTKVSNLDCLLGQAGAEAAFVTTAAAFFKMRPSEVRAPKTEVEAAAGAEGESTSSKSDAQEGGAAAGVNERITDPTRNLLAVRTPWVPFSLSTLFCRSCALSGRGCCCAQSAARPCVTHTFGRTADVKQW